MNLSVVAPSSFKDNLIRAAKTAVFTFVGVMGSTVADWNNLTAVKAAGITALAAGASIILNVILSWANSPTP